MLLQAGEGVHAQRGLLATHTGHACKRNSQPELWIGPEHGWQWPDVACHWACLCFLGWTGAVWLGSMCCCQSGFEGPNGLAIGHEFWALKGLDENKWAYKNGFELGPQWTYMVLEPIQQTKRQ